MISKLWQITILLAITFCFVWKASGIMCYSCRNCGSNFNSSHVSNCTKTTLCLKMVLMNEEIDRSCGDKKKCAGRDPRQRQTRSISSDLFAPRRRIARGLLDVPTSKEQSGAAEASSIHCCNENECNGSPGTVFTSSNIILSLLGPFLVITWQFC